jgi:hypothetical protein
MKLVESDTEVFRLSDRAYKKVLQAIVDDEPFSNDDLAKLGKSLGFIEANLIRLDSDQAKCKLAELKDET